MINTTSTGSDAAHLAELIKDVRVAMLMTVGGEGRMHARPMYTLGVDPAVFDGTLWFFTDTDSAKVHEIGADRRVAVCYSEPGKNRYVAVYGDAVVDHDPAKARELWSVHAKGWWPEGPESARLCLVRVSAQSAEYWDGPSNTAYMLRLARAIATGERIKSGGEHEEMRLKSEGDTGLRGGEG